MAEMAPTAQEARHAALEERVTGIAKTVTALDMRMTEGFQAMSSQFAVLSSEIRGNQRTPWGVIASFIGVFTAIIVAIGSQALAPLRVGIDDLKAAHIRMTDTIIGLSEVFVTKAETEPLRDRAAEEREATRNAITALNEDKLSHAEWNLRNVAVNDRLAEISARFEDAATLNRTRIERLEEAVFAPAWARRR